MAKGAICGVIVVTIKSGFWDRTMNILTFAYLAATLASTNVAQEAAEQEMAAEASAEVLEAVPAPAPMPLPVQTKNVANAVLPANTEVLLKMNQEVTTKGKTWDEGDTFALSVVHDVTLGDYVVIPAGSRATGRITWLTNKGMFGKSGKMDVELEYVTVNGRRIDLEGTYRQEGEGNTVATVAGVIAVPIAGLFITGRSGRIPQGREMMATTETDIELAIPASEITAGVAPLKPTTVTAPAPMPVEAVAPEQSAEEAADAAVEAAEDAVTEEVTEVVETDS
jgi:hypothetical protein